jgi:YD repeat-containing protein
MLVPLLAAQMLLGQQAVTFRYFYDDNAQLFRALDSTGNLIEYTYDPSGNVIQTNRKSVAPGALSILNITPLSGGAGNTITIYGQNFSTVAANNIVQINGVSATVLSATATQLTIQVPSGVTGGQMTVTVNGTTASSGPTLVFTPNALPVITSITPDGAIGGTTSSVNVSGANLTGAAFTFNGGATAIPLSISSDGATATVQVTPLVTRGVFAMVATTPLGSSPSALSAANHFIVLSQPDEADTQVFSVLNETIPTNAPPDPSIVSSQAESQAYSVLNEALPTTGPPDPSIVSNEADSALVSLLNSTGMQSALPAALRHKQVVAFASQIAGKGIVEVSRPASTVGSLAGQTRLIGVRAPEGTKAVELTVDGVPLLKSERYPFVFIFNLPVTPQTLTFSTTAQDELGVPLASETWQEIVSPDAGTTLTGRVLDELGVPVPGAKVKLEAAGLGGEVFEARSEVGETGAARERQGNRSLVAGLNWINPQGVFGQDPIGLGTTPRYVARYTGNLIVTEAGEYGFEARARAGAVLSIDGRPVSGHATLTAGSHAIEVRYYKADDPAQLQLLWTMPNGHEQPIPGEFLVVSDIAFAAIADDDGSFSIPAVPAKLDGVRVLVEAADGRTGTSGWSAPVNGVVTKLGEITISKQ